LADRGDRRHVEATRILATTLSRGQNLVTTNHVIGESYTLLRMRLGANAAQVFLRRTRASTRTRRVFVAEAWEDEAETVLARFADHDFSFVDATSFVVMRRLGLRTAFAFDHHFLVAGFLVLSADS
jgi:predicted nucleic acid-binding protein